MRIALIAPPFIEVPPTRYGGTELFVATLAAELAKLGHSVVVYGNGASNVPVELRFLYPKAEWPMSGTISDTLKALNHSAWAIRDAFESCDIIHGNDVFNLSQSRFADIPFVYTLHHTHDEALSEFYSYHSDVQFVAISEFQKQQETMPGLCMIRHGIDVSRYCFVEKKQPYLSFLGRISPAKGPHLAIAAAKRAGIPLKIAGDVLPVYRDYFESKVKPHLDNNSVEYLGSADFATKNELLANSLALLFPIRWNEPFGLVMIEAMACGTPVLALPGGSVNEIVCNGINGYICHSIQELADKASLIQTSVQPANIRRYAEDYFSSERMAKEYEQLYRSKLESNSLPMFSRKAVS